MKIPVLEGIIERRILVNYVADADVVQALLPDRFRPKLYRGKAIVGICLIGLRSIRPKGLPAVFGIKSENAAHRIAVEWDEGDRVKEGVYIPRRDTGCSINAIAGGRLFPGEHNKASFKVSADEKSIRLDVVSADRSVFVVLKGEIADELPKNSWFEDIEHASEFFRTGSLGYSVTNTADRLQGVVLRTKGWRVRALNVQSLFSSFFEDAERFPPGSVAFDHALIMQNIEHEWHGTDDVYLAHANA